jgi:serine protease Do
MKHFSGPYRSVAMVALPVGLLAAGLCIALPCAHAQAIHVVPLLEQSHPLLAGSAAQGYLGVDVADVDTERAQALKLKVARGAVITLIDHDAPAGQVGLHVNDVVLEMNGQTVENADQLRRMLREIPAGRKITLAISRDGVEQTLAVELVDRQAMAQSIWNRLDSNRGAGIAQPAPRMGILAGSNVPSSGGGGFHLPFFGPSLNVGVLIEPLTAQMAQVLGISGGLMVKQVARKSAAEAAGIQAFDVILKVGEEATANTASWDRAIRANLGKQVPITILRDRKPQTLTLQVDSRRK